MTKFDFLTQLRAKLWSIPEEDRQRSVDYYAEMISDRMEDGLSEEDAVAAVGNLEEIVRNILAETPAARVAVQPVQEKRTLAWWEVLLLVLGAPLWVSLLIAVVAIGLSVIIALWVVVITLYAVTVSLGASAIGCVLACFFMAQKDPATVLVALGAALICAGLTILFFMLSNLAAKGAAWLSGLTWKGVKRCFGGKEQR